MWLPQRCGYLNGVAVATSTVWLPQRCGYPIAKKVWRYVYSFRQNTRTWRTDGRTNRWTDSARRHRPFLCIASTKLKCVTTLNCIMIAWRHYGLWWFGKTEILRSMYIVKWGQFIARVGWTAKKGLLLLLFSTIRHMRSKTIFRCRHCTMAAPMDERRIYKYIFISLMRSKQNRSQFYEV